MQLQRELNCCPCACVPVRSNSSVTWLSCLRVGKVRLVLFVPSMELKNQLTRTLHPVVSVTMAMSREKSKPINSRYQRLIHPLRK
jgi:hypothetical protein